jgi:hypothetical protein
MRARIAIPAVATSALLAAALPGAAAAKGIAGAELCGAGACHAVATRAVRAGVERFTPAPAPDRAEPYLTLGLRARASGGELAIVGTSAWLPRANVVRAAGERRWTRPAPGLTRALRQAARGLVPHPPAGLGDVSDAAPAPRVVEVFAPADRPARRAGAGLAPGPLAAALAAAAALALAATARRRAGRAERPPATLPPARS